MKNILAALALVAFSMNATAGTKEKFHKATDDMKDVGEKTEQSYKQVPNPVRPLAGTLVSPLGNTISYVAEGLDIVAREGVEAAVTAVYSSGQCITKEATHPGELAGCVVKLGGDGVIVIWNTAGYSVANVVSYGGEMISDVAFIWRDAANDLKNAALEANIPVLSPIVAGGAYVVGFVFNASGVVVKVTFSAVADGIRGLAEGGASTIGALVDVPVSLLRLNGKRAMESLGIAMGSAACTGIDLVITTPLNWGASLLNAIDKGNRRLPTCFEQAKKDFQAIRNGTFVPKQRAEDLYQGCTL